MRSSCFHEKKDQIHRVALERIYPGNVVVKDFTKLVLFAFVAAVPISYFVMTKWLQNFAFRTGIQIWIFLLAGLAALIIAQLTTSFQALKAANTHPADAIRIE